jgi:hypothetical protein
MKYRPPHRQLKTRRGSVINKYTCFRTGDWETGRLGGWWQCRQADAPLLCSLQVTDAWQVDPIFMLRRPPMLSFTGVDGACRSILNQNVCLAIPRQPVCFVAGTPKTRIQLYSACNYHISQQVEFKTFLTQTFINWHQINFYCRYVSNSILYQYML